MRKLQCKEQRRREEIWFRSFQAQTNVQHDRQTQLKQHDKTKLKATLLSRFITLISTGGSPEESLARQAIPAKQNHSQVTFKTHQGHQAKRVKGFWCSRPWETLKTKTKRKQKTTPKKPLTKITTKTHSKLYLVVFFFSLKILFSNWECKPSCWHNMISFV